MDHTPILFHQRWWRVIDVSRSPRTENDVDQDVRILPPGRGQDTLSVSSFSLCHVRLM
jgi:hypothetical protein